MPILQRYNYSNYLNFQSKDSNINGVNWSYSDGFVTLLVDFSTDLEGRHASVNFSFNQLYIRHDPILL